MYLKSQKGDENGNYRGILLLNTKTIFYKKTDEWYIEWQRVTTKDNEWQRVVQQVIKNGTMGDKEQQRVTTSGRTSDNERHRMTTSDNEWYNEWQQVVQRVIKSGTTGDKEWQRVTKNGNEWQWVRAVVQQITTAHYTLKNRWLPSFQWQKEMH